MNRLIIAIGLVLALIAVSLGWEKNRAFIAQLFGAGRFERSVIRRCDALAQKRKEEGLNGRHALALQSERPARYVLMGALNGKLDSYNRILGELKRRQILDADVHIIPADTYLVINGPLGDTSPFEMLPLLMDLIEKNPFTVFIVRGEYEDREFWAHKRLGKRIAQLDPYSDRLRAMMRNFFNTLPVELYLYAWGEDMNPVCIAWDGAEGDGGLACKLVEHKGPIKGICMVGDHCGVPEPALGAQIESRHDGIAWDTMNGLQAVGNPPVWHLLSNPSSGFEQKPWLSYDAYAIINLEKTVAQSTIELYSASKGAFSLAGRFNLVSGKAVTS